MYIRGEQSKKTDGFSDTLVFTKANSYGLNLTSKAIKL
ncbi:hypothetical protein EV196_106198 [Mariniflexile fucanivorans]|uniref:Uncharacterized protein n=1 Tax=Mariniflexile fucanivorans TaxID=264023 RepID=A0A4V2QDN4_9FLAO|nr:hypothetical protein EV196_106198 [Mariniflexile fucanivorans]